MNKKRGKAKRRNRSKSNSSTLSQHKRVGKKLLPPMLHLLPEGKLSFSSWVNNRLPEVLWAVLASSILPRPDLLRAFLRIAERLGIAACAQDNTQELDITHSSLDSFVGSIEEICSILLKHPAGRSALRPLLLFEAIPGRDRWASILQEEPTQEDAFVLATAVGNCLEHQSQHSTDIRWLTLMFKIGAGKVHFPGEMVRDLLRYADITPDAEEMRFIRPSIRSAEIAFRMMSPSGEEIESAWCGHFWREALERSECVLDPGASGSSSNPPVDEKALQKEWFEKQNELVERFIRLQATTGLDARFDTVFGTALFAGNVLLEVMHGNNRFGIGGRLLLRTLVECRITLAYLIARDDTDLWLRFRRFGAGQAKLALLKFDDSVAPPKFLSEEALTIIANEDSSEEFVSVELGHWCDADLRKMADFAGVKDDYNDFYGWSSAFVHGNWSAIRDASLAVCLNPLHRLHRVPRGLQRRLESTLEDAVSLFNKICADVDRLYAGISKELVVAPVAATATEEVVE